jgi:pimeloyl-ACP methyl ester carboxylesterase
MDATEGDTTMALSKQTRFTFPALLWALAVSAAPAPPAGWTDGYVMANGIRIHYWRTGGDKPVMILAHGSSDDGLCWTNFAKELTPAYDVIMYDARGHGLSDPPQPSDPPDAMVEDLAGLIRELKLVAPIIVGHSMGSSTAAWFAAKYPEIPRAVVLEDPNLAGRRPSGRGDPEERRAQILARNNMAETQLVDDCMKNSPKWGASECAIWAPSKRRHHPNTAAGAASMRPAMEELLSKVKAPTLILKADAEGEERKANEATARLLPNGRIVHIRGAGHNVRREGKEETLAELKRFLAGL